MRFCEVMGRTYVFHCSRCQYRVAVSGGREEGFHCVTQTVACADCKALYDVPLKMRVAETTASAPRQPTRKLISDSPKPLPQPTDPTKILLFGEPPRTKWVSMKPDCPVVAQHRASVWSAPGKCPRCGDFMERTVLPFRVWD